MSRWKHLGQTARVMARLIGLFSLVVMSWFSFAGVVQAATGNLAVVEQDVFLLPGQSGSVQVLENLQVKNTTSSQQTMSVPLPAGFSGLKVTAGGNAVASHTGTSVDVRKLAANATTDVVLSYNLTLSSQEDVQFTLHSNYPVYTARIYLPIGNASLSAQGLLTDTSTVTIGGSKYRVFTRPGIPSNSDWTLSVQMLPSVTSNPKLSAPVIGSRPDDFVNTLQAIFNLVIAAFILVIGLISIRATQWGKAASRRLSKEEALLQSWENIELQFQEGSMPEAEYRNKREQIKQRLLSLRSQIRRTGARS